MGPHPKGHLIGRNWSRFLFDHTCDGTRISLNRVWGRVLYEVVTPPFLCKVY